MGHEFEGGRRAFPLHVVTETAGAVPCGAAAPTGNVPLLLTEIRHALERLAQHGTRHTIDLRAIPLGPGEESRLLAALGEGELRAEFDALGRSEIRECGYPGVWCITHADAAGHVVGRFLEITYAPELLGSAPDEVRAGLERLTSNLSAYSQGTRS